MKMSKVNITNLQECIEEIRQAGLKMDPGPADPIQYNELQGRLHAARSSIPPLYMQTLYDPFMKRLQSLGQYEFYRILNEDPKRQSTAGLLFDIAQSILQRAEGFEKKASAAFQEVVSDLYDGFLSVEDRAGVALPDEEVIPPLVKFGNPESGPYTWPVDATKYFGLQTAIVNLPPANAREGILAWSALAHETAGHDILHADKGLLADVSIAVRDALNKNSKTKPLASYWASRIDESASDVLGILNMGPAPAIGLIGYFRGLNAAYSGVAELRNDGPYNDSHPADILRGFLAAATVKQLEFSSAADWSSVLEDETHKDVKKIEIEEKHISEADAKLSAQIVSSVIVTHPMPSLENHAFGDFQTWRDSDEQITEQLQSMLTKSQQPPSDLIEGVYAAHLVAAATIAALKTGANISLLFERMLDLLKAMNDKNPSFGALGIQHPGDMTRIRVYSPFR
jgi:hypothetical protein